MSSNSSNSTDDFMETPFGMTLFMPSALGSLGGTIFLPSYASEVTAPNEEWVEPSLWTWEATPVALGGVTTQQPEVGVGIAAVTAVGTSASNSTANVGAGSQPDGWEPFYRDSSGNWHLRDAQPYSQVERRAQAVAGRLMKDAAPAPGTPCFSARSREAYDALMKLTGGDRDAALTELEALALALSEDREQDTKQ